MFCPPFCPLQVVTLSFYPPFCCSLSFPLLCPPLTFPNIYPPLIDSFTSITCAFVNGKNPALKDPNFELGYLLSFNPSSNFFLDYNPLRGTVFEIFFIANRSLFPSASSLRRHPHLHFFFSSLYLDQKQSRLVIVARAPPTILPLPCRTYFIHIPTLIGFFLLNSPQQTYYLSVLHPSDPSLCICWPPETGFYIPLVSKSFFPEPPFIPFSPRISLRPTPGL